ncbi:RNA polymerase-binding transcription factor DksA [Balamuthia mandrillaris]
MTDYAISQWHIFINTNKKVKNTPESCRLVRKFTRVIQDVFSEENAEDMLQIFEWGKTRDPIYSFQLASSIEWKSARQKRLHAHVLVFITHSKDSKIHLVYGLLKESIIAALGMPVCFQGRVLLSRQTLEQMQQNQINYILKEYMDELAHKFLQHMLDALGNKSVKEVSEEVVAEPEPIVEPLLVVKKAVRKTTASKKAPVKKTPAKKALVRKAASKQALVKKSGAAAKKEKPVSKPQAGELSKYVFQHYAEEFDSDDDNVAKDESGEEAEE